MVYMVEDWIKKNNLSKMGYKFDPRDLSDFEVSCYGIISNKFQELEILELQRKGNGQHNDKR